MRLFLILILLAVPARAQQPVTLFGEGAAAGARFGAAVAFRGDLAVVGAPGDDDGEGATGAAYVFRFDGLAWRQEARLTPPSGADGDAFGAAVGVDGDRVAVGAPGDDERGNDAGAVYVFFADPVTGWTLEARLTASDAALGDAFGTAVALSGLRLVAGAPGDDDGGFETGAAYAFSLDGPGGWSERSKLTAAPRHDDDAFGPAVALDGDLAVVGVPAADDPRGDDAGLAFLFARAGAAWVRDGSLAAADAAPGLGLGAAVALDAGAVLRVLAGAPDAPVGGPQGGAAYLFENPDTLWTQRVKLTPALPAEGSRFGAAVALEGDRAAVGAPGAGAVYVFAREADVWTERVRLTAPGAAFGAAVALDGGRLLAGAPEADAAGLPAGAAYVFDEALLTATEAPPHPEPVGLAVAPNPAREAVEAIVTLPAGATIDLAVFDVLGRPVAHLASGWRPAGQYRFRWQLAGGAGVYMVRLLVPGYRRTRPVVVVR